LLDTAGGAESAEHPEFYEAHGDPYGPAVKGREEQVQLSNGAARNSLQSSNGPGGMNAHAFSSYRRVPAHPDRAFREEHMSLRHTGPHDDGPPRFDESAYDGFRSMMDGGDLPMYVQSNRHVLGPVTGKHLASPCCLALPSPRDSDVRKPICV